MGFIYRLPLRGRTRRLFDVIIEINRSNELHEILTNTLVSSIELFEVDVGCIMLNDEGYLKIVESYGFPEKFDYEIKIKIGETFIGRAAQKDGPSVVSRFINSDPYIPFLSEDESILIIPLKIEDRLIGILYLESKFEDYFRSEVNPLQILSVQAAVAINRAQLQEEREKTREALFTSAKAVAAGQIATGFVHEVKNRLNTIGITVRNIRKRIEKEPNIKSKGKYIDKIATIEKEILRSYDLSIQLQKFGQRLKTQKDTAYLNEVVKKTFDLLGSTIRKKNIKLELKTDPALDRNESEDGKFLGNPVYIDTGQIEQVIINLILNAIEASSPRSRLLVETKLNESTAEIKIKDYGKGIESNEISNIFKPFFTTKTNGVGLGLYISKLIVEDNHQGEISVKSKPGKGTTFSVIIPIAS